MSGDWTLLSKAAAGLFLTEEDRVAWQVLSARARAAQKVLTDPESAKILSAMAALVAQRARILSALAARAQGAKILSVPPPLVRLALTEAESVNLAELNHQLGSAIRHNKFRKGEWQFGWSKPGETEPPPVPDFWRQFPIHIDPFGSSMTWQGETLSPVLVRDAKAAPRQRKQPKGKPPSVAAVRGWIRKNIPYRDAAWDRPKILAETVEKLGCSWSTAKTAFTGIADRRRRGERTQRNGTMK